MDIKADPFETLRRALQHIDTPSSDYDLNPSVLAQLPKNRVLRPASVLIPLIERRCGIQVILTQRSAALKHHPGQVAFPGGKVDVIDVNSQAAALREAEEEIGLRRENVDILGGLGPHETVTGFSVTPFLGRISGSFTPVPEPGEVTEVFEVPLDFLLDTNNFQIHSRIWQGAERSYLAIPYGPHFIWGATARMLKGLADRMML